MRMRTGVLLGGDWGMQTGTRKDTAPKRCAGNGRL